MATSSLDIAIRADDQASPKLAALNRSMTTDIEAAQKTAFDLSHTAREREERDVQQHYAKLRALAQQRIAQNLKGEEHAAARIEASAGEGKDLERAEKDLAAIRSLRKTNQDALVAYDQAEAAQRGDIAKRAEDEKAAIEKASADRRTSDLDGLNKRVYNATHNAKEREIADVKDRSAKLLDQYKNDAEMRKKIVEAEEDEIARIRAEGGPFGRFGGRFGRRLASLAGKAAIPAAAAMGTMETGLGVARWYEEKNRLESDRSAEGGIAARSYGLHPVADAAHNIPLIKDIPIVNKVVDDLANYAEKASEGFSGVSRKGLEEFGKQVEKTAARLDAARGSLQGVASAADQVRAGALGLSGLDQVTAARDARASASRAALTAAQSAGIEARNDYAEAQQKGITGAPLEDFRQRAERATMYIAELNRVTEAESAYSEVLREQARDAERREFNSAIANREARVKAEGQGLAGLQASERTEFATRYEEEMAGYKRQIDQRRKELGDRQKWITSDAARRTLQAAKDEEAATGKPVTAMRLGQIRSRARTEAEAAYAEEQKRVGELEQRRDRAGSTLDDEKRAMDRRQRLEAKSQAAALAMRGTRAGLSGDTLAEHNRLAQEELRAQHEEELRGLSLNSPEWQARKDVQDQERTALINQQAREQAKHRGAWRVEAIQAEAASSRSYLAIRNAEITALEYQQSEEERIQGRSEVLTRKHVAERAALQSQQTEDARARATELGSSVLRAGRQGVAADILESREKYRKMEQEYAGDPAALKMIGALRGRDEAALAMRMNVGPRETQTSASSTLRRVAGYDDPILMQTKELQQANKYLAEMAKFLAKQHGINVQTVDTLSRF